jgi:hypothetical protein
VNNAMMCKNVILNHFLGLVKTLNAIGCEGENVFTPIQKLEHVAPNSTTNSKIIHNEFYEFKVNIVKCIANLTYRNKKNQKLVSYMTPGPGSLRFLQLYSLCLPDPGNGHFARCAELC